MAKFKPGDRVVDRDYGWHGIVVEYPAVNVRWDERQKGTYAIGENALIGEDEWNRRAEPTGQTSSATSQS